MLALLALLALAATLLTGATTPATAEVYSGTSTDYLTPTSKAEQAGERVRIGFVKVPSPGTYHANLRSVVKNTSVDTVQYVAVSLICKEESTLRDQIGAAANTLKGETITLNARVYFSVKKRAACFAYGTTMGLKNSSTALAKRRLQVTSTLTIGGPVSDSTKESKRFVYDDASRSFSGKSFLAKPKVMAHAAELETSAFPGSSAFVTGNVYLTTCSFQGGSRDQTTNGKDLCTKSVTDHVASGSLVRIRLVVKQYTPGGSVCATTIVPGSTVTKRISQRRHHLPMATEGDVTLPDLDKCGNKLRVYTEVRVGDGPAVVVHFPSSVTAYSPT